MSSHSPGKQHNVLRSVAEEYLPVPVDENEVTPDTFLDRQVYPEESCSSLHSQLFSSSHKDEKNIMPDTFFFYGDGCDVPLL